MMNTFGKCCSFARNASGLTQEQAAPLLGVVTRTLSGYECDNSPVPEDVVLKMMEVYDAEWLGFMFLKMTSRVGNRILPAIQQRALSAHILDLQVEMDQANNVQKDLARVGRDDKITPDEIPVFLTSIEQLMSLCGSIYSIVYASIENEKPPVREHRRLPN